MENKAKRARVPAAQQLREAGKALLRSTGEDAAENRSKGLAMVGRAAAQKDPEACFLIADLTLRGVVKTTSPTPEQDALRMMAYAANRGCPQARAYLNRYCAGRYKKVFGGGLKRAAGSRLLDQDGNPIRIDRQGIRTPVDAVLKYENGRHVLQLSVNIRASVDDSVSDTTALDRAILDGINAWEGRYEVFGGQELWVKVKITAEDRLFDSLTIIPVTPEVEQLMTQAGKALAGKKGKQTLESVFKPRRSFVFAPRRWSVYSRKVIYLFSDSGRFDDYDELMHVIKHEFGHVLGLGDLYAEEAKDFAGVQKGTYAELDSYAITDRIYNLVMCDHHGPVTNNDIEMVLLAFCKNRAQLFQTGKKEGTVSAALGKGN